MRGRLYLLCFGCLALGILSGRYTPLVVVIVLNASLATAGGVVAIINTRLIKSAALPAVFFSLGSILVLSSILSVQKGLMPRLAAEKSTVTVSGRIVSPPSVAGDSTSLFLAVGRVLERRMEGTCRERILLRVKGGLSEDDFFPGVNLLARGRLGASKPDDVHWLLNHGAACVLQVRVRDLRITSDRPDLISSFVHEARVRMSSTYNNLFPPRIAGLIEGITLSKTDRIDSADLSNLRSSGLSHIVAVSGLHVGSVAMITLALMGALGAGRKTKYASAGCAAMTALALANFRPSALRASLMSILGFSGSLLGREYDSAAGVSLAGMVILTANPRALFDPGFQFSFAASMGIVIVVGKRRDTSRMRVFLTVCAGAQLGILPLMLMRGEGVPVTAVAANLLVVPLVGPLLLASWGLSCVSPLSGGVAAVFGLFPGTAARYILAVSSSCSRVPRAGILGSSIEAVALTLYIASLAWIIKQEHDGQPMFRPAAVCVLAVILLLTPAVPMLGSSGKNKMTILDVGEGEATLIQDGSGAAALVDGGPDGCRILEKLQARRITKLDVVVLTHPHSDHVSGLVEVLKQLPVGRIVESGLPVRSAVHREFREVSDEKRIPRSVAREGQVIEVSKSITLEVLYAPYDLEKIPEDLNDCSMVIMAQLSGMRALLTGDISSDVQEDLLDLHPNIACDVLKVPHQGAREAALKETMVVCRPALATISAGRDNKFGHPSRLCLELLSDLGIQVARTDRDGDVEISVHNGRIALSKGRR